MNFQEYWDTRINVFEELFSAQPGLANFAFLECQLLHMRMEARYNALREAVEWERECEAFPQSVIWNSAYYLIPRHGKDYVDGVWEEFRETCRMARAEVDRLLGELWAK